MSQVHSSHSPKSPVRSIVPHMIPQSSGASSARPVAAGHSSGSYSGSATVASSWNAPVTRPAYPAIPGTRRKSSEETLEALLPVAKWGVAVLLLVIAGFGISRLVAGSSSRTQVETHAIQVKALLGGKPMPGASMTLTPILSPEQTAALDGDLSAGLQLVGRAVLGQDGVGTPALSADQPGLPAGEYIASLTWCKVEVKDGETVAGPDLVPQIFRSPSTSTLRVKVAEGSNSLVTLQVVAPKVRAKQMTYDHE
jgi:hypothetical protein